MMSQAQPVQAGMVRFVLVGGREGFSGYLGGASASRHKFAFSQGVCTLTFQDAELAKKNLAFFAAYPEDSQELLDAQAKWAESQGDNDGSTEAPTVYSDIRPAGQEPSEGNAEAGARDDEAERGSTGSVPDRDGSQRPARKMSVADAVAVLDHNKPEQWTTGGKPMLKLIQQLCVDDSITRAEVDELGISRNT